MRVRHLQSHLSEQGLIQQGKLEKLSGMRIGLDAAFWLRTIQGLKDPFADALGGIPPGIFGFVDKELDNFKKFNINPLFVFQGITPPPQHQMFAISQQAAMDGAWDHLATGDKQAAQKTFAVSTSRINFDVVHFIMDHLRAKGYDVFQAPYFAGSQLAHFAETNMLQAVFGAPGLLLYGVRKVIISLDFNHKQFEWVELNTILNAWGISKDQFVNACMLAGTEYCLTYPYLNLDSFAGGPGGTSFKFDAAVDFIRSSTFIQWMDTFPTPEMRDDHVEGYCVCKVLIQSAPVLNTETMTVQPLQNAQGVAPPCDISDIIGQRLPDHLYLLMCNGIIGHKLPAALSTGEWNDKSAPMIDTQECRQFILELTEYREKALGLIASCLSKQFEKEIVCYTYFETNGRGENRDRMGARKREATRMITPYTTEGLTWSFKQKDLLNEMERQGCKEVDMRFCLAWHAHEFINEGPLYKAFTKFSPAINIECPKMMSAMVHFMLIESLGLVSDKGGLTVLGNVLKDCPSRFQEPCLVALELMKFGMLACEPFEPTERPFPASVKYYKSPIDKRTKSVLMLSRSMGLIPLKLKDGMWDADIDFDLAAFHSLIRILKRSLRQMTEACLAHLILKDFSARLPLVQESDSQTERSTQNNVLTNTNGIAPTFFLPRACMGIIIKYFLNYEGSAADFPGDLTKNFPCAKAPMEDLQTAIAFWAELLRCVAKIASPLEATDLLADMTDAQVLLTDRCRELNIPMAN